MKSFLFPLFILVLLFSGCSEEFITTENHIEIDIQKRSYLPCIESATCVSNYKFPVKDSGAYNCFVVQIDNTLTSDQVYCLRQAYFECFPLLKMSTFQSTDPYVDTWCYPIGKPVHAISTTIDEDPRVDDGG